MAPQLPWDTSSGEFVYVVSVDDARAFSVKTESPKMLYPFDFEPVLIRKPPTLFGNRLYSSSNVDLPAS